MSTKTDSCDEGVVRRVQARDRRAFKSIVILCAVMGACASTSPVLSPVGGNHTVQISNGDALLGAVRAANAYCSGLGFRAGVGSISENEMVYSCYSNVKGDAGQYYTVTSPK